MKHNQIAKPRMISYGRWEIDVIDDQNKEHTIETTDAELVDRINYDELDAEDYKQIESYFN